LDLSTTDPEFLATLARWFETEPELLVLFRFRAAAGARDYELYSSLSSLTAKIRGLRPGTAVTVFRERHLPIRGIVDDALLNRCVEAIPAGAEYLLVETTASVAGSLTWFHHGTGESHAELREDLESSRGKPVAVGVHPVWPGSATDTLHGVVPDTDGVVRRGPY
jgi:hypothetical protein